MVSEQGSRTQSRPLLEVETKPATQAQPAAVQTLSAPQLSELAEQEQVLVPVPVGVQVEPAGQSPLLTVHLSSAKCNEEEADH